MVTLKGCNDRLDKSISHHLGSNMSAIELNILCTFVWRVGCFDAQNRETLLYK